MSWKSVVCYCPVKHGCDWLPLFIIPVCSDIHTHTLSVTNSVRKENPHMKLDSKKKNRKVAKSDAIYLNNHWNP